MTPRFEPVRVALPLAAVALALLGGCAVVPPSGPSVVAMPRSGEPLSQFQQDDYACRDYAFHSSDVAGASQNATTNSVNSAAVGTFGGAAVGALLGAAAGNAGAGAAIGAGSGLLVGGAAGANGAQYSANSLQARYDAAYAQCMTSKGNTIAQPQVPVYAPEPVYAPPAVYVAPRPRYYGPPPVIYAPYPYY
ncbi:glycine zipper family protein [Paraburkholderia dilworthii]|uniref:glycine zipper family protein n=1 Tax=Paraburkholderia dilworthii TaxID=948106 RepID=UPI000484CBA7|nr:glycine zipper family protein [Paraburkholderia dilworthii]